MINWKIIAIGFILVVIMSALFGLVAGTTGSLIGIITASTIAGYKSNENLKISAIHGAFIGMISGIAIITLILLLPASIEGIEALASINKPITIINTMITCAFLGVMGSAIGARITKKSPEMETVKNISKVKLNIENIQKCACIQCQVQAENLCAKSKIENLKEMMKIEKNIVPEPKNIPGMYCMTGISKCSGLNTKKACLCPNCEIFKESAFDNKSINHFCKNGVI